MNILYIAPASDFASQVAASLRKCGHAVEHIDDRLDYSLPRSMRGNRFVWRMSRRIPWLRRRSNSALQQRVLAAAQGKDVVFAGKGMNIQPITLTTLKRQGVRTAVWFPDNAANEPYATWVRESGPLWDYFFSFDSAIAQQVPVQNTHVLPFAADASYGNVGALSDEDHERYACDVCFVGAPYPDRVALLSRIQDLDVRIWGWKGWLKTPLAHLYRGALDAQRSAKAYRLAKVSVNTNVLPMACGVNLKTFEICAAGGFQLTDAPTDLGQSFEIGSELVTFTTGDEFERELRRWLPLAQERHRIADAGRERVLRDHTLEQRMKQMLDIVRV